MSMHECKVLGAALLGVFALLHAPMAATKQPSASAAQNAARLQPSPAAAPSATLPLHEVLELYRQRDRAQQAEEPSPPVNAIVERLQIDGRVLDKAVTATAQVSVQVLAHEQWVAVPILELADTTVIEQMPDLKGAALVISDGQLLLVTQAKGRYRFTVGLASEATIDDGTRSVTLGFANATLARCRLGFDPSIFTLRSAVRERHGDVVTLHTRSNRCALSWRHRDDYSAPSQVEAEAPQAEPVIPSAHASLVSTLEGEHILRVAYTLRFAGRQAIAFDLPAGHRLLRAYLDGRPISAGGAPQRVEFEVFAARAGQIGGQLELVLAATDRDYLLSGTLGLVLPRPSWRTNKLYLSAHLPAAFDYTWSNGTLSPGEANVAVDYVYDIPLPGKALHFRQFLVHRSTPSLTLQYAVSLQGHYFRVDR